MKKNSEYAAAGQGKGLGQRGEQTIACLLPRATNATNSPHRWSPRKYQKVRVMKEKPLLL